MEVSDDHESDPEGDQEGSRGNKKAKAGTGRLDQLFSGGSERKTSMRLTYIGPGYPLTLIV